jgi:hypothetical protein
MITALSILSLFIVTLLALTMNGSGFDFAATGMAIFGMAVQARQNNDTTPFVLYTAPVYREDDATIEQDAGRATDLAQYTLMAKKPVTIPTTMTADGGNTGDGTVTGVAAASGGIPIIGTWELECITAVANGGTFKLTDPNGNIVATGLEMVAGAGGTTDFIEAGIAFTITDGATDFIVGDKFTLAVTANGKYVPFAADGVDGSEIPLAIYMNDDIDSADIVAGDVEDNPMLFTGAKFDEDKLVFDDGTTTLETVLSNGKTVRDTLHDLGLIPTQTQTASRAENA